MHALLLLLFAAEFEAGPTVTGRRVDFTLKKPADVGVAFIDAKGRIVRHLAARLCSRPVRRCSAICRLSATVRRIPAWTWRRHRRVSARSHELPGRRSSWSPAETANT